METNKLKKFAADARINLMDGVRRKLCLLGFDEKGRVIDKEPEWAQGATLWQGEEYPESFYQQWTTLRDRLRERGVREVVEEAAYTWFNRMMAIRILTKNDLCEPILRFDPATGLPLLLAGARMGRVPEMSAQERIRYDKLMDDDNRTYDQFALLLTVWCHANPIISSCFGSIHDYVELLLPDNILRPDGFLAKLNDTPFITEDDYKSAELIGWLYQFYISDRKDEVFAKKGKVESEEIPAATQIFTPNWIVKYMVENTILPQVDADEEILEKAKYLVKTENPSGRKVELEDLKVADFACGSGHILNECFDLLFAFYRAESYSRREAIECIFTKNLTGIDIDLRAKQLATFALLLKACQQDASFADAHCMPYVITVPEMTSILKTSKYEDEDGVHGKAIKYDFFQNSVTHEVAVELDKALSLVKDADSLGSIIKFDLSSAALRAIKETAEYWQGKKAIECPEFVNDLLPAIDFILALTDSYDAIVMNPPYMGGGKMDSVLSKYVKENYKNGSADLATVFVEMAPQHLTEGGKYAFIVPPSWTFLGSFESFRVHILKKQIIDSFLHLSRGVFGADFGSVACVLTNTSPNIETVGTYFRLIARTFQEFDQRHLKELFEKTISDSNFRFNFSKYTKQIANVEYSDEGNRLFYPNIKQYGLITIPGSPITAYFASKSLKTLLCNKNYTVGQLFEVKSGLSTGDNDLFLRFWHEVNRKQSILNNALQDPKWRPYTKGLGVQKWYGNNSLFINWENNANEMRNCKKAVFRNESYYFKSGITWSGMSSTASTFRYLPEGYVFDSNKGPMIFSKEKEEYDYILALLNSCVGNLILKQIFNPSVSTQISDVERIPLIFKNTISINRMGGVCLKISIEDWDAHETSWDFQANPLVLSCYDMGGGTLEDSVVDYEQVWEQKFRQLHANEEELNRQFIEIYGLQDELTPDVPLNEITILQQGEVKIDDGELKWQRNVLIQQLISYIVGCFMGRYRLDRIDEKGLHIAHHDPTEEELAPYQVSFAHDATFTIDSDGIMPILPQGAPFYDNLSNYVEQFVKMVWEEEDLQENMNFIEKCLGKPLNDYLMKDFWKYHKKMYQNRPIYWEFASKKGAFRALVYAHRMDRFTVEVLRSKYLLSYIAHIEKKVANMESRVADLSTPERRELDTLRDKILPELREYADRVEVIALQNITFDLDDGIIKNHALFGDIVTKIK